MVNVRKLASKPGRLSWAVRVPSSSRNHSNRPPAAASDKRYRKRGIMTDEEVHAIADVPFVFVLQRFLDDEVGLIQPVVVGAPIEVGAEVDAVARTVDVPCCALLDPAVHVGAHGLQALTEPRPLQRLHQEPGLGCGRRGLWGCRRLLARRLREKGLALALGGDENVQEISDRLLRQRNARGRSGATDTSD